MGIVFRMEKNAKVLTNFGRAQVSRAGVLRSTRRILEKWNEAVCDGNNLRIHTFICVALIESSYPYIHLRRIDRVSFTKRKETQPSRIRFCTITDIS